MGKVGDGNKDSYVVITESVLYVYEHVFITTQMYQF